MVAMPSRTLHGSRILLAGATGVLGSGLARALHARGAKLALTGRRVEPLALLGAECSAFTYAGDLRDPSHARRIASDAAAHLGGLDGLVNAAGVVAFGNLIDTPDDIIEDLFLTNVLAPLWLLRATLPHMESGSFVVQVSGVVAESPLPGMAAYCSSKAALFAADVALARELRRVGVSVLDARPPHTETGLAGRALFGTPPKMATGLGPQAVVDRIIAALETGEADLPSAAFA